MKTYTRNTRKVNCPTCGTHVVMRSAEHLGGLSQSGNFILKLTTPIMSRVKTDG